ncbi:TonB-dependent receptor [Filimonas effusa]|uniref:TonB-dependent receptor n=1 Tax=Filimonas effusa TaxID=2508721 RepID=A0A4Q1DA85_9BACT|nr:TonB-dependent receptor [Filimonas effusa]RXK85453.1 TonB-dependent receptor [Filimonas effusa]
MRIHIRTFFVSLFMLAYTAGPLFAQQRTTVSGTVNNSKSGEPIPAVSIAVIGAEEVSYTDARGFFRFQVSHVLPMTLVFSSVGFASKEVMVSSITQPLSVSLEPGYVLGEEIVVAATRTSERLLESPVSVERISTANILNAPAPSYYDGLANLKGVDVITSSLMFKSISTRGFNGSGNLRLNQLVDGMDNQAPGLNFPVGSVIGLTELDVDNMELLPGASSALYGPGGMSGTLLINSKNPFKYQGVSAQVKTGMMHLGNPAKKPTAYHDISFRWAQKVSDKLAFKIGGQYIRADDWQANDRSNLQRNNILSNPKPGDRQTDNNYDGVNVFGDEASTTMQAFAQAAKAQAQTRPTGPATIATIDAMVAAGATPQQIAATFANNAEMSQYVPFLIPLSSAPNNPYAGTFGSQSVSRTGYDEKDLVDYNAYNLKLSAALHYKLTPGIEAALSGYWGMGTTVYTGADRFSLKNLQMGQYKLELKANNWFFRAYTTQENSGDSYTANTAAVAVNNAWKNNATWFQQYTGVYGAGRLGILPTAFGTALPDAQAHAAARGTAEQGRYLPGTPEFRKAFDSVINIPISKNGARFSDRSALYQAEAQYNLSEQVRFMEVLVGASFKQYALNSKGTIFADTAGIIHIKEYGAYLQLQKQLLNDVLKLSGSVRYDKNENFKARFTPRFTALVKVARDNNIRLSYQTAYRFPSTQDQYINLNTPAARLIGGLPQFNTFFRFNTSPAYTIESIIAYRASIAAGATNPALLKVGQFEPVRPESMQSFELGYRSVIGKKLMIDAYGYYSRYKDFIARVAVGRGMSESTTPQVYLRELANPLTTTNYSFVYNVNQPVKSYGWGLGLVYKAYKDYIVTGNVYSDKLSNVPAGVIAFYNTPEIRYNLGLGNENAYKNFGFNVILKWQGKINWQGTFGTGEIPSYTTLDAQVSYKIPSVKSMIKIGGTNITNSYYRSAFGNPYVGGLYYVSLGYNVF